MWLRPASRILVIMSVMKSGDTGMSDRIHQIVMVMAAREWYSVARHRSFGIVAPTSLGVQMVSAVIRSIGWGLLAALIHSMVGDAIEYGHWRTGHKAPGTTYAAQGVGNKLGVLIGSGVTTLILGASGYDGAAAAQVASALSTVKGVYLYLPLAFAVVIFVIMCFYKLNSKNYNHIVSELEQGRYHPNAKYAPHSEA